MKYGMPRFVYRDVRALAAKGHTVHCFPLINRRGLYNPDEEWRVTSFSFVDFLVGIGLLLFQKPACLAKQLSVAARTRSIIDLVFAVAFYRRIRQADIVFSYFGDHKLFVGYYCKKMTGLPLVVTVRAYELQANPNPTMFRRCLQRCDQILTITDYNKHVLVDEFGAPAERIEIIRQIVDLEKYSNEPRIKVLIVAFFAEKKGHDILFKALRHLDRDDVELWVVGDNAPDRNPVDCRKLAGEYDVEGQVCFFGEQSGNALNALYRECDLFCLPSRTDSAGCKEGFPNAIAEAMAFGKPVVATMHAGIPEAIDRLLVPENDVESLASALDLACSSIKLRKELGKRNRLVAERMFSPENNDILERALQACTSGTRDAAASTR